MGADVVLAIIIPLILLVIVLMLLVCRHELQKWLNICFD